MIGIAKSIFELAQAGGTPKIGDLSEFTGELIKRMGELPISECGTLDLVKLNRALLLFDAVMAGTSTVVDCYDLLNGEYAKSFNVTPVQSYDPNDKTGLLGEGAGRFTNGLNAIPYMIQFENKSNATAAAQDVFVTDPLNFANLDLNSLTLGPISFGNRVVHPPSVPLLTLGGYATDVDLRPTNDLLVRISVSLNSATGVLKWELRSLDPSTGQPPSDPLAGFLPPGVGGAVLFTVAPKMGLPPGTQIRNGASIVFDINAPILTPDWVNTIDNMKPTSRVLPLPTTALPSFGVQWSGSDVGSGVASFTVYASDNGGPFAAWLTNTTATQANFTGLAGHTYRFYSIARDFVGNVEGGKTSVEATTTINVAAPTIRCTGCYFLVNNIRATFAFNIGSQGSSSTFSYNYRNGAQIVQFASTSTTQRSVSGNTATFSGPGNLNGQTGYFFAVTGKDGGTVGSGLDTVSIAITGPNNYSYTANGTVVGGDIIVQQ